MTRYTPLRSMQEFVDLQNGCVSRAIFVNDGIYQQEQEQVFARPGCSSATRARAPNRAITS